MMVVTATDSVPWQASATLVGYGAADFNRTLLDCVQIWSRLLPSDQALGLINSREKVFGKNMLGPEDLRRLATICGRK
jgi:hypothetical protein